MLNAVYYGHRDVVELLIEKGADVNQKNGTGRTVMELAKDEEMRKVIIEAVKKKHDKDNDNLGFKKIERE